MIASPNGHTQPMFPGEIRMKRAFNGRVYWSRSDDARLNAELKARGTSLDDMIDWSVKYILARMGEDRAGVARIETIRPRVSMADIGRTLNRSADQVDTHIRELARKAIGISGDGCKKNSATVRAAAIAGARTVDDLRAKSAGAVAPSSATGDIRVIGGCSVVVSDYMADVTPRVLVSRDVFCRRLA